MFLKHKIAQIILYLVLTYFTCSRTISPNLVTWEEAVWPNTRSLLQDLTFELQFTWMNGESGRLGKIQLLNKIIAAFCSCVLSP